jgi:DNA-binding MarR family transcriptional regulator
MKSNEKVFLKEVSGEEFYSVYLSILNGLLHLTPKEIDVLAQLMYMKNIDDLTRQFLSEEDRDVLLFGVETRKIIQKRLGITQHNLNNYIKSLKDKGLIKDTNGNLSLSTELYVKYAPAVAITFKLKAPNV